MTEISAIRPKQAKNKRYILVRYGKMDSLGWFEHNEAEVPKSASRVVVKTEKGLELGYIVGQVGCYREGQFRLSKEQVKKYFDDSQIEFIEAPAGRIVRFATQEDVSEEKHLQKIADEEMESCRRFAKEINLDMKIVDAEHIFGGERIIFYFMAETRVDFRDLVKKLAHEYQTRIEMRQIGSRDEAKLLGDVESCGQECCCKRFLKILNPVNMRMAKVQKATLDPSKISGYCGRLKCCLRYEDKTYTELKQLLPPRETLVKTQHGQGKVVDTQILTQLVVVEHGDGERLTFPLSEIEIISMPARKNQDVPENGGPQNGQEKEENAP